MTAERQELSEVAVLLLEEGLSAGVRRGGAQGGPGTASRREAPLVEVLWYGKVRERDAPPVGVHVV
eukprot:6378260-Pyramimonas_sp.AAC.1